jgi:hypothetical protein
MSEKKKNSKELARFSWKTFRNQLLTEKGEKKKGKHKERSIKHNKVRVKFHYKVCFHGRKKKELTAGFSK